MVGTGVIEIRRGPIVGRVLTSSIIGLLIMGITGCDVWYSFDRIGVSLNSDGGLLIHYVTCDWEQITVVRLTDGKDPRESNDNEVLWEIQSTGADGGTFAVGTEPTGFTRTILLEDERSTDNWFATITIDEGVGGTITFNVSDLEVNKIWAHGASGREPGNLEPGEFEERARETCATGARHPATA